MTEHEPVGGWRPRFSQLRRWCGTAVVVTLVALAATAAAGGEIRDERLSTTLLGRLEPGGEPRLAVRWDGPAGLLLDVWVDLDGDGELRPGELVGAGRPLAPGIEVVPLEIATEEYLVREPNLWVQASEPGRGRRNETGCLSSPGREGCAWQAGFVHAKLSGPVLTMAVFDDGTGPALYVGGSCARAGGVLVNNIARWDGSLWSALSGPSDTGTDGDVYALAVHDDGTGPALYAGGEFTHAGGVWVNYVARWDGTAWSTLSGPAGRGVSSPVSALAVFDSGAGPVLYAGGDFSTAGGVTVNHVAEWDGSAWSALTGPWDTGVSAWVRALTVHDDGTGPALYAGGEFETAGGVTVNYVAKWDGSAWSALSGPAGTGLDGTGPDYNPPVNALAVYDDGSGPALYAGGTFERAGGVTVNDIARWDGSSWSALSGPSGAGITDGYSVDALAAYDDGPGPALYVGGNFVDAGGVLVNNIARWDGSLWSALSGPSGTGIEGYVNSFAVHNDGTGSALYAGGWLWTAGGVTVGGGIATWDGSGWSAASGPTEAGLDASVLALIVHDGGSGPALYAGGEFTTAGAVTARGIARWDGTAWSAVNGPSGTGIEGSVHTLAVHDDGTGLALYAGGAFYIAGGVVVNRIARWDGFAWSALSGPVGTGTSGVVDALCVHDDGTGAALFAGGAFVTAGGVTVNHIAKWDGNGWSALTGPLDIGVGGMGYATVHALSAYDDGTGSALYAGGSFTTAGGVTVNYIAKWDGSAWSALSGASVVGTNHFVYGLGVHDDGTGPALYAGGSFRRAGGVEVNYVARWDGSEWSALSGPAGIGMDDAVGPLAVHDDGTGSALYAGGSFTTAGGVTVNGIAKWDGSAWSGLSGPSGTGMARDGYPVVSALSTYNDGSGPALFAGGWFTTAGGLRSINIAAWRCVPGLIFADGFETGDTSAWSATTP